MNRIIPALLPFILAACGADSRSGSSGPDYLDVTALAGAATSTQSASSTAFSYPMPNLSSEETGLHLTGDKHFELSFITAVSDDHPDKDGLGPVFNNTDCNSCHRKDGRSSTLLPDSTDGELKLGASAGIFLRISLLNRERDDTCSATDAVPAAENDYCAVIPVPDFGDQLFHRGVLEARSDWNDANNPQPSVGMANVYLSYEYSTVSYADGTAVTLKKPVFHIRNPYDAPDEDETTDNPTSALLQPEVVSGPRNGMPMIGLGLLEAIPEADILALADPHDRDGDGISGRANYVFDQVKYLRGDTFPVSIGRFGWKANTPTVRHQSLGALRGDIGITNAMFNAESTEGTAFRNQYLARHPEDTGTDTAGNPEAGSDFTDAVVFYAETLAVPARRNVGDSDVRAGGRLFTDAGCSACHHPSFTTSSDALLQIGGNTASDALKGQKIWPFTDMLLHDMGNGLADGRRDFLASGQEWKTRPLWGIGLTKTINPSAGYLHDGRASTLEEAILWHGGEAGAAREQFRTMEAREREQLISFLRSL